MFRFFEKQIMFVSTIDYARSKLPMSETTYPSLVVGC